MAASQIIRKVRRFCATALATALFACALHPAAARADLVFATEGNYPPWNLTESDGTLNGFDINLVRAICARLDTVCSFETASWPAMMDELAVGEYDAIISGIAITAEREETIQFTRPYMSYAASFAAARGSPLAEAGAASGSVLETLELLKTARIGAQDGTVNADFVESVLPDAFLVRFPDQESLNGRLANGEVEAALAGTAVWSAPGQGTAFTILGPPITSTDYPGLGQGLGIGVAIGNDALKAALDAAICDLVADGTVSALTVVWFGHDLAAPCPE
jgi:octopine/nopaline transport system substrate-binding protein